MPLTVVVVAALSPSSPHEAAKSDTTPRIAINPSLIRFFTAFPPKGEAAGFASVVIQRTATTETQPQLASIHQPPWALPVLHRGVAV
jgi:hypothetical protein